MAERESRLIGQGLRDTLPAELLAELPPAAPLVAPQKAAAGGGGEAPAARPRKTWPAAAAAKQRRAAAAAARVSAGLGKLVREAGNVEYSLPPPPGAPRGAVSDKVRAFAAEAMMGRGRVKRAPAAGIGSLKPHGGRLGPGFAPARNFATAEARTAPAQSCAPLPLSCHTPRIHAPARDPPRARHQRHARQRHRQWQQRQGKQ